MKLAFSLSLFSLSISLYLSIDLSIYLFIYLSIYILCPFTGRPVHSLHLLGPLHGPEWILENADIPHLRPITGSSSVEGTFLWAIGLFGTVENGATVITVLSSKRCRRPLHILVGTLGFTDLFISMVYIPSYTYFLLEGVPVQHNKTLKGHGNDHKQNGNHDTETIEDGEWNFCRVSRSIFIEIASVTVTIKALIAMYLYIYTRSKQYAEQMFKLRNTIAFILLAWILNFAVLFVPHFIGFSPVDFYPNAVLCLDNWQEKPRPLPRSMEFPALIYSLLALFIHILELLLMCVCFIKVHLAINEGRKIWLKKTDQSQDKPHDAIYSRAMKTTILLFATFTMCWIPIYIVNMVDPLHDQLPSYMHHIAMDLLLLKSALNPAIYIYGIRSLRRELKLMCLCKCRDPNARNLKLKAPRSSSFESGETRQSGSVDTVCGNRV